MIHKRKDIYRCGILKATTKNSKMKAKQLGGKWDHWDRDGLGPQNEMALFFPSIATTQPWSMWGATMGPFFIHQPRFLRFLNMLHNENFK